MDHLTEPDVQPPGDGTAAGVCPFTIARPVMRQRWERLTFLHWPYDPAVIQRLLPEGLSAEPFGGAAWVSLVPFFMRVATPGGHRVPWASDFCETNVRTYVRDDAGRTGIWFLSLDAARLGAVITARTTYRLPYFWSAMRLGQRGAEFRYLCRRRWPGPRAALSRVHVSAGEPFGPGEASERDHFLTARWRLYSVVAGRLISARACHQPWPLHRASAPVVDDHLLTAAGLPGPQGRPLVHYSPGVDVAIGPPDVALSRPAPGGASRARHHLPLPSLRQPARPARCGIVPVITGTPNGHRADPRCPDLRRLERHVRICLAWGSRCYENDAYIGIQTS